MCLLEPFADYGKSQSTSPADTVDSRHCQTNWGFRSMPSNKRSNGFRSGGRDVAHNVLPGSSAPQSRSVKGVSGVMRVAEIWPVNDTVTFPVVSYPFRVKDPE